MSSNIDPITEFIMQSLSEDVNSHSNSNINSSFLDMSCNPTGVSEKQDNDIAELLDSLSPLPALTI
jgi:hypothetical protein